MKNQIGSEAAEVLSN